MIEGLIVCFIMVAVAVPAYFAGKYFERCRWLTHIENERNRAYTRRRSNVAHG